MFSENRYQQSPQWFRSCGHSGLQLPAVSLGCWHNFGAAGSASHGLTDEVAFHEHAFVLLHAAFDCGITHFDLANNYGPPPGAAEERVGRILKEFPRHELVLASKAGYRMWPGPYGDGGSRKYLVESCDQSLKRLDLDHLDIFYHHRPDETTPLEETLAALDFIQKSGRALYVGISNYSAERTLQALELCEKNNWARPIIHQPRYNMFDRKAEEELIPAAAQAGIGLIAFSPLAQGLLSARYLDGIPDDSRAASSSVFLKGESIDPATRNRIAQLNAHAAERGQTLAQMAIAWALRSPTVVSALIGASRPDQIQELALALEGSGFDEQELQVLDRILSE
ncbi:MAG: aldo/keto reductase [Verrucomicrobiales bacterium]